MWWQNLKDMKTVSTFTVYNVNLSVRLVVFVVHRSKFMELMIGNRTFCIRFPSQPGNNKNETNMSSRQIGTSADVGREQHILFNFSPCGK